jgi:hypothetical protein
VHATQAWAGRSQTGVTPRHCALLAHATQTPAAASHTGVAPAQRTAFVAEHWPQVPVGSQAGVAPPH